MSARRILVPLLIMLSMLVTACGSGTGGGPAAAGGDTTASAAGETAASTAAAGEGAASTAAATEGDSSEQIELRVAWWGSQDRHDRTIKVLEMFMAEHPNITVSSEFASFGDYWTKMSTQAAGNSLPDVMQQDYAYIKEWADRQLIRPLDEFVGKELDLSKVDAKYVEGGKVDGKLVGVNLGSNSMVVLLDPEDFAAAGVEIPGPDWTWAEFEQICTAIKEKTGKYCSTGGNWDHQVFKTWLKEHGQWLYNEDGTGLGYEDDRLFVDFFSMIKRMQDAGLISTREEEAARGTSTTIEEDFVVTDKAAMSTVAMWSNQVVAVTKAAGDKPLEMHLLPQVEGGTEGHYLKPSMFFSVTTQSQHPREAAMLIDYFTNNLEANKILLAERGVPISSEIRSGLEPLLTPVQQDMFEYIRLVEQHSSPIDPPDPAKHPELMANVYAPVVDEILYGQLSPEEGAARFREEATALLSQ